MLANATPAQAQAFQCRVPQRIAPLPRETPDGPVRRLPITGYTLALSWSPEFCRTRQRDPAQRMQCGGPAGGGVGRFGFVVHGLWPESGASWPQWCQGATRLPAQVARGQLCRTPSPALLAHAWAKHGSCMTRRPEAYFKAGNILFDSLGFPELERLSRDPALTAGALRAALAEANPGRPAMSFGLLTSGTGWLREVRVCLDRRFRPARCPARQFGPRDAAPLKIWRGL